MSWLEGVIGAAGLLVAAEGQEPRVNRPLVCVVLPVAAWLAVIEPAVPATAAASGFQVAVTFDSSDVSGWVHSNGDTPALTLATTGSGTVRRDHTAVAPVPREIAALPGVRSGDRGVGAFPGYSTSGGDFAAVAITPSTTGYGDQLAPGTGDLTFGADVVFPSLPADATTTDNGNNVIQRGLAGGDQYKIQVDSTGDKVFRAGCDVQDQGRTATSVINPVPLAAGHWYRLRCSRTRAGDTDQLVLGVTDLTTGSAASSAAAKGVVLSNLDYPSATPQKPIPASIGAKVYNTGAISTAAADQFNGQIDNGWISIG
jgi:hypothetical protein